MKRHNVTGGIVISCNSLVRAHYATVREYNFRSMHRLTRTHITLAAALLLVVRVWALDGDVGLHDPSTIVRDGSRFYVYATGGGLPMSVSDDGWTWRRAGGVMQSVPGGRPGADVITRGGNNTWAPDVIKVGDKYFLYYAAPGTQPKAAIGLLVGKTLDPSSPDYKWTDAGPVVWSDGVEDSNAIDPGVFRDPANGSLWLTYGSYFGYIRLVELDPKTGKRLYPQRTPATSPSTRRRRSSSPTTAGTTCWSRTARAAREPRPATASEWAAPARSPARTSIAPESTCCRAVARSFSVRPGAWLVPDTLACSISAMVSRSSHVTSKPIWIAAASACSTSVRCSGVMAGRSPATTSAPARTESNRCGRARHWNSPSKACRWADAAVVAAGRAEAAPVAGARPRHHRPRRSPRRRPRRSLPIGQPDAVDARLSPYLVQAQQKWSVTPVANAGGYAGSPYFRISVAGTERSLTATAKGELTVLPTFTGSPEQLWRIDQLADGTYRLTPKTVPGGNVSMALSAIGGSSPTLERVDANTDRQRWLLRTP